MLSARTRAPRASTAFAAASVMEPPHALPPSQLAVFAGDTAVTWWRSTDAPVRWSVAHPAVAGALAWNTVARGVELSELRIAGTGEAWRLRVVVVRVDPRVTQLRLHAHGAGDRRLGPWSVERAPAEALVALNAGQFDESGPWGWLVHRGREQRTPGIGSLSGVLVVDTIGGRERTRLQPRDSIASLRERGGVLEATQSYPLLLEGDGAVPPPLTRSGLGVNVAHRDARLAIGELRDGRLLIVLTRFEGLGGVLEVVPFGLTVPETAALMGALGCRFALALDGGISGQLLVRGSQGAKRWPGLRSVPIGMVVLPAVKGANEPRD